MSKRSNTATVILGEKKNTYKGNEYLNFVGVLKIKGKDYLLSVQSEGGSPKILESREGNPIMYVNVVELKPQSERKRRNEL